MLIFTNKVAERCARWILVTTSPAPLSINHPARDDMATAADEIERLSKALAALRDDKNTPPWVQTLARATLEQSDVA